MDKKVIIIVLNYNNSQDTIECIESLKKIEYDNFNIIVVDNKSTDDSMSVLSKYIEQSFAECEICDSISISNTIKDKFITLIQTGYNGGYGYGNNIGIKYALSKKSDYVLILNNDTIVNSSLLDLLVNKALNVDNLGILSCKINFFDRPDVIWFNGGSFNKCTGKVLHYNFNEKDTSEYNYEKEVSFISGCLWFIPRETIETVGFINEEYFMYVEDLEYCYRVNEQGKILVVMNAIGSVYHKVGSSSGGKTSDFSVFWRIRNMNKFLLNLENNYFCKAMSILIFNIKNIINILRSNNIKQFEIMVKAIKAIKAMKEK